MEEVESALKGDAATDYYKFNSISFHWINFLGRSNSSWPLKHQDIQALKMSLDARYWFTNEGGLKLDDGKAMILQDGPQGKRGVEMYIGHYQDARMVLLFTAQWMHLFTQKLYQRGKTSKEMTLPPSLPQKDKEVITDYERFFVTSSVELRDLQKKVDRHNKQLSHEESMSGWAKEYEEVRRIWRSDENKPTFIGFDVETYEQGHHDILEVGWSIVGPKQQEQESSHYIIEESYDDGLRNGRYVPDNRRNFLFGKALEKPLVGSFPRWKVNGTEIATMMDVGRRFARVLRFHRRNGPVYIVFHDSKGDMKVMDELGIETKSWLYSLLGKKEASRVVQQFNSSNGDPRISNLIEDDYDRGKVNEKLHPVYILDTQLLFAALRCGGSGQKRSLQHICIGLDVNGGVLGSFHNAANDAYYTAAALAKMAQGPHFTIMRTAAEERLAVDEQKNGKKSTGKKGGPWKPKAQGWD